MHKTTFLLKNLTIFLQKLKISINSIDKNANVCYNGSIRWLLDNHAIYKKERNAIMPNMNLEVLGHEFFSPYFSAQDKDNSKRRERAYQQFTQLCTEQHTLIQKMFDLATKARNDDLSAPC